ncbi:MAG: hypothetical protein ABR582_01660 [Gemmatimonadaceae bacterium]
MNDISLDFFAPLPNLSDMSERRFNEEEVAAIFRQASEAQSKTSDGGLPSGEGLTVTELAEIGRQVGISSDLITQAAQGIERSGNATSRQFLGFPIGVGQTVDLGRKLSDEEWERLVVDLRETFHARGALRKDGSLRQWTNGNLQALVEPAETGDRVRLRTTKGDARNAMALGIGMFGVSTVGLIALTLQIGNAGAGTITYLSLLMGMGIGLFGFGALRLPSWARERRRQMSEIAARLTAASKPKISAGPDLPRIGD